MANRSKKVVLSARVDPYLKDGLEIFARMKNKKIVETLEELIEGAVNDINIDNPFLYWEKQVVPHASKRITLGRLMSLVWSPDETIFHLRLSRLGNEYFDEAGFLACAEAWDNKYFQGEDDVFEYTQNVLGLPNPLYRKTLNLDLIRAEWDTLKSYASFLVANKPLIVTYEQYKAMLPGKSD